MFFPTAPPRESGSPHKEKASPLDPARPTIGMVFETLEAAIHYIKSYEHSRGYQWRKGETQRKSNGELLYLLLCCTLYVIKLAPVLGQIKRLRLLCSGARKRTPNHDPSIDPADMRKSLSKRCGCSARANIRYNADGFYRFTSVDITHTHPAFFDDNLPEYLPASADQKTVVHELALLRSLSRRDIHTLLKARFPDHPLTPRQVSNMIDTSKREARNSVSQLGGDMVATVELLVQHKQADDRWVVFVETDPNSRQFRRIFWMSPTQVALAQRFGDVIINDITYQRNKYSLPLNLFIVIDHQGKSRNIAYALHTSETIEDHKWVLNRLFSVLPPSLSRAFFSDFDLALDTAVSYFINVWHGLCIHHMGGNLAKNLASILNVLFQSFQEAFWQVYNSISPAIFEAKWNQLLEDYPLARDYLQKVFWPVRERWAWAWVSSRFTCGVRTSGRVEGENRINKLFSDSKMGLFELVKRLIDRADEQSEIEQLNARQVSAYTLTYIIMCLINVTVCTDVPSTTPLRCAVTISSATGSDSYTCSCICTSENPRANEPCYVL